jgi:FdrA protein
MRETPSVEWATAVMGTPANVATLHDAGVPSEAVGAVSAGDFCLAVRAGGDEDARQALESGAAAAFAARPTGESTGLRDPRTIRDAMARAPESNVAIVSVPGAYAELPTYQALSAGMHVLLFSDNVPRDTELALKQYAHSRGLLVMGPGAGTAMLGGVGLGFANVTRRGRVGVVAAAGTGAQEAMTLLDRWGVGVSHVIGVGGGDVSTAVGGIMSIDGIQVLRDDPGTDVILLVSKPPSPDVAHRIIDSAGDARLVAAFVGLDVADFDVPDGVVLATTLESGVARTLDMVGHDRPSVHTSLGPTLADVIARMPDSRTAIHGLYSGGTLCYEAQVVLSSIVGGVYSNAPLDKKLTLPAPSGSHQVLDLGEEEYTKGRPHPMIDAEARLDMLREHGADPTVAVILLDVVLGYGSHPDPAGVLAPVCATIMANGGPQVVAYVLGTDADPQGWAAQRATLAGAGCIVTETSARAALTAAAIAQRDVSIAARNLA